MFRDWDSFYLLIGGSAGALIGLMFVVATLTSGQDPRYVSRGAQIYITPIVFHFAVVMIVSAISAVPEMPAQVAGVILAFCAATGIVYTTVTTARIFVAEFEDPPDWADKCFYGFAPTLAYIGLAGAAGAVWFAPESASYAVGATMLVLLLIGIRNAWDLATYMVQRTPKPPG